VRILARLDPHPHVAAALHASDHQGRLYLVMEYVPGQDLKAHVQEFGPLPWARACACIRQAAEGLAHAHRLGVVHRDVKPSNLMLTPDGTVKLLDLGLARLVAPEAPDAEASQTQAGTLVGTLNYMAPEQAEDARRADARSDLYGLGCTFYYLLAGRAPFEAGGPVEKLMAHALRDPEPLAQVCPDVPPAVAAVVHRLLAKDPEERYPSARSLIDALGAATGLSPAADVPGPAPAGRTGYPPLHPPRLGGGRGGAGWPARGGDGPSPWRPRCSPPA
jgi:serine/threonine protein kinase